MKEIKMFYYINEIFYSIQGEGSWVGTPVIFIRLAGCNLSCKWCDTLHNPKYFEEEEWILHELAQYPCNKVVLTGGEPLNQNLDPLLAALHFAGYSIHLETNCTLPLPSIAFDWIVASPKYIEGLNFQTLDQANDIKIVCGSEYWKELTEVVNKKYKKCKGKKHLYLMPLDLKSRENDYFIATAYDYVKANPWWKLCAQIQKYYNFK